MIDPHKALVDGLAELDPLMREHGFEFVAGDGGVGSGGRFARGAYVAPRRRITLSYRYGLGDIQMRVEAVSIAFEDYLRALGNYSEARYPSSVPGAPTQFADLAHDLRTYCQSFLDGDFASFGRACSEWESNRERRSGFRGLPG